ncbi:LacI family DNA-binding transcriptional regulator [Crocinitomix catalasitica]|uniref:LacI family DNA-binding transcriptional regulator n=1 Tax=Crocinitomix catalasitica TaxID=184607 RepID=UPI0004811B73|nr:LacI family DNA-binding transcriptional regulator [Crocinitomix catalasitica]
MKKVSLKDIAEVLGVSKALVSLVLNDKGNERGINAQTQERVRKKAKELNYIPNQYARGLRVGRTNTIGVIVPDISNVFYGTLCKAIEKDAYAKGYNLIISNSYEDIQKEKKLITELINRNIDGLILASSFEHKNDIIGLNFKQFPVVLVDRTFDDLPIDSVSVSNYEGAFKATKYLVDKEVNMPVCFAISPSHISSIAKRVEGFKAALKDENAKIFQIPHDNIEIAVSNALEEVKKIGATGIFCSNNSIAKALLKKSIQEKDIFNALTIVSFDDVELFDLVSMKISAIAQPIDDLGVTALRLLLKRIESKEENPVENVVLDTTLIER